jgi:serine/threonine protein kinase
VYRARDTRLDRTVAIKVLPEHLSADPQFRERFDREARAVAALNHPHICAIYDVGSEGPSTSSGQAVYFLVMEHLEGETLAERLSRSGGRQGGAMLPDEALPIAIQIAEALAAAHRAGIVHRDLKPGNIFLVGSSRRGATSSPLAKLLDFGLARTSASMAATSGLSMMPTEHAPLTAQGTLLGTFQYMAPEQIEGQDADARTDLFALGVVLYEMLTGKRAFEGKTQASLFAAILEREPPAVTVLQPLVPSSLDRVIRRCLAKNPDDRWQSAGAAHGPGDAARHVPVHGARADRGTGRRRADGSLRARRGALRDAHREAGVRRQDAGEPLCRHPRARATGGDGVAAARTFVTRPRDPSMPGEEPGRSLAVGARSRMGAWHAALE